MHSISEVGTNVPAFLAKLWKLVEDPTTNGLILWSANGSSFLIRDQAQFSRQLLPLYYKHNNLASFIRQLNMYGFHKVTSVEGGGLKVDKDEMEFAHKYFLRGHPYLLDNIKRKIPTGAVGSGPSSSNPSSNVKPELVSRVLQDVRLMKGRQETLDSRFNAMKRENEALWRELALLRQKHMKQQQIVNKLIQFLVTLVQPNRGLGIKRTYPLMLNDTPNRNIHPNPSHGVPQPKVAKLNLISDVLAPEELSPKGPVIHELDNNTEYILPDDNCEDLSGVEFDDGQEEVGERVGAGAGVPLDTLRSGNGCYDKAQPVSPEVAAEAGDIPNQLTKELDRVVPLVHSPLSSLGNLDSRPSSPTCSTDASAGGNNQKEGNTANDSDPQPYLFDTSLLPSVEYPLSPEMFMGSVDPAVISPAPRNQGSKKKGQGLRSSKNGAKGKNNTVNRVTRNQNNRRHKRTPEVVTKDILAEALTQDMYPEIHLEEGNSNVNDEESLLLDSVVTEEETNEDDLDVDIETPKFPEEEDIENNDKEDSKMAVACTLGSSVGERENSSEGNIREELDMHLDTMQSELDMLKDMLMKGNVATAGGGNGGEGDILSGVGGLEGYCLDASALLGVCPASLGHLLDPAVCEGGGHILTKLFGLDDPVPFGINSLPGVSENSGSNTKDNSDVSVSGTELATYNPTLMDLVTDDDSSQILDWCHPSSYPTKDPTSSTSNMDTSRNVSKGKESNVNNVVVGTGKGSERGSSLILPKTNNQVRRKSK